MELFKRGGLALAASVVSLGLVAAAAQATPPPVVGTGLAYSTTNSGGSTISIDGSLGGSTCDADINIDSNANDTGEVNTISFYDCVGAAGTPFSSNSSNAPVAANWPLTWNAAGTGGTITGVRVATNDLLGFITCGYSGNLAFSYSAGAISVSTTTNLARVSGGFPCPTSVSVTPGIFT